MRRTARRALGTTRFEGELTRTTFQLRFLADVRGRGLLPRGDGRPRRRVADGAAARPAADARARSGRSPSSGPATSRSPSPCPVATPRPPSPSAARSSSRRTGPTRARRSCASSRHVQALRDSGAPAGVDRLVHGLQRRCRPGRGPGHPRRRVHRVGGRCVVADLDIIQRRPDPIPFYGELACSTRSSSRPAPRSSAQRGDRRAGSSSRSRSARASSAPSPAWRWCPPVSTGTPWSPPWRPRSPRASPSCC